jgi:hypothetical protein
MAEDTRRKLTPEQVDEIRRRVLAGEKGRALAVEFGVTRAYVSLIKCQAKNPEKTRKKNEQKLRRLLTPAQEAQLEETIGGSKPEDHEFYHYKFWSRDAIRDLAQKLFGKSISVATAKRFVLPPDPRRWDARPQPPRPRDVKYLSPELAADPEFVAYYLSPIALQIEQKTYEFALKEWEKRYPEAAAAGLDMPLPEHEPVLLHRRSRGRPKGSGVKKTNKNTPAPQRYTGAPTDASIPLEHLPYIPDDDELEAMAEAALRADELAENRRRAGLPMAPAPGQRTGKHAKNRGSAFTPPKKKRRKR